jgi:branched-chain amino acid transport system ATP-binding protein
LLQVSNLQASYGFLQVLWDVSLEVQESEFVGLVGPNGAGKTTTLRSVAGQLKPKGGQIVFQGDAIKSLPAYKISRRGISYVSENLNLFTAMSVRENLLLGAYNLRDRASATEALDFVLELFPRLGERLNQLAGTMSGGERKMLAIARGMMGRPRLLLIDEPSLGLAPYLVTDVFEALQRLRDTRVTILMVEQRVNATLEIADRIYVLESGRVVIEGTAQEVGANPHVQSVYLGI